MCNKCKIKSNYKPSPSKHGRHPVFQFRICVNCGSRVQGTVQIDGSFREFSTSVYKGGTHSITLRLNDDKFKKFKQSGKSAREVFELGLSMVNEP